MMTRDLFKTFLVLFIIWSGTVTASVVDKLEDKEKLFGSIQNRTIKYSVNPDGTKLTSLACFEQEKNGIKKCTVAESSNILSDHPYWNTSTIATLNYSNYESKETEIIAGLEYPDVILLTLLKSKKNGKVFIDIKCLKCLKDIKNFEKGWQNVIERKFEVGVSMWSGNKKPIVYLFNYGLQIFYENPKENKILRTTFAATLLEPKTNGIFPEYYWSEIDQIIYDGYDNFVVFSHKYLNLSFYNRAHNYYLNNRALDKKIKFENLKVTKIQDVQLYNVYGIYKLLITATSIEESKSQLLIIDEDELKVEKNLTLDLLSNVDKVYFRTDVHRFGRVDLYEIQCESKTGDCTIFQRKLK